MIKISPINIAIFGIEGRMGSNIASEILNNPKFQLSAVYTHPQSQNIGRNIRHIGINEDRGLIIRNSDNFISSNAQSSEIDIIIDFTQPEFTHKLVLTALKRKIPLVIGTTGLDKEIYPSIKAAITENQTSIVLSSNMLKGIQAFYYISEELAEIFSGWDIEIIETHHRNKLDAPSGTAKVIVDRIARRLGEDSADLSKYGRYGTDPRDLEKNEIGIHSIRGGDIPGEHKVIFSNHGQSVEILHRAYNREGFVKGTIEAALFLASNSHTGEFYDMKNVYGIQSS